MRRIIGVALTAAAPLVIAAVPLAATVTAAAATSPACLSAATIASLVGVKSSQLSLHTGSESGGGATYHNCDYGSSSLVSISYATPATTASYNSQLALDKKSNPTTKTVAGIGSGAFSYELGSHWSVTALFPGKSIVEVYSSDSKITLSQVEAVVKKAGQSL